MTDLLRRTLGEQVEVEAVIAGGLWNTSGRSQPDRKRDPQSRHQCARRHAGWRQAHPGSGQRLSRRRLCRAPRRSHAGPICHAGGERHRQRHDARSGEPVFEPFFTTKPEGKGTGLGLAQAYGFVKQSGGHIKIYSEVGEGTTVKIYLPRTRRAQDAAGSASQQVVQGGSERILVVEDDEGVRAAVIDMLTDLGYRVQRAENAGRRAQIARRRRQGGFAFHRCGDAGLHHHPRIRQAGPRECDPETASSLHLRLYPERHRP